MNLFDAITRGDWDLFNTSIARGDDVFAIDHNGNTVLHRLAGLEPVEESVFSKKKSIRSYFIEILQCPNKAGRSILDLALIQNKVKNTAMHDAFSEGNWPLAHLLGELVAYNIHHQHFRQNEYGLNEYEWALVHYGFYGKCNEIEAVFGMSTNVLRQGSPTLRHKTNGLVELKKAVNNIKIDKDILCRAPYSIAEWQSFSEEQKEYIENNEWLESKHLSFLGNEDIKVKYRPN